MNAVAQNVVPLAESAKPAGEAFASITLWVFGSYFLQVHYGYFDSWEDAEDFPAVSNVRLEEGSSAVFLVHNGQRTFIPDGALQVYRNVNASVVVAQGMTLDDLLEEVHLEDMRLMAIGHTSVIRGKPIIAHEVYESELVAANDPR